MPNDDEDDEDVARLGSGVLFLCSLAPAAVAEAEMEEEEDHIMSAMDNGVAVTLCVGGYICTLQH